MVPHWATSCQQFSLSCCTHCPRLVHAGYRCPHANCQVLEHTWGKLQKHMIKHPGIYVVTIELELLKWTPVFYLLICLKSVAVTFTCQVCQKVFKKAEALRRHKRVHASHKPVLVCPRENCQAYFSTTFNLQHHIRKVHLDLFKYKCSFPDCPRMFTMRVSNKSITRPSDLDVQIVCFVFRRQRDLMALYLNLYAFYVQM